MALSYNSSLSSNFNCLLGYQISVVYVIQYMTFSKL